MTKPSKTIIFFGSGPVAAKSLELLSKNFTIEAVITKPRPLHHKGDVPVLRVSEKLGLVTHTVTNKKMLDILFDRKLFRSELSILIDFGIIVSQKVIDYFPLGIINSHFSLLPEWRGADPITFSILSGQKTTGVSLMLLTAGMDEGPILAYSEYELTPTTTTPQLTDDLIQLSYSMLVTMIPKYLAHEASPQQQDPDKTPTYSRKLSKDDSIIDWRKSAIQIEREIRAFVEWPKSHATVGKVPVIITQAHVVDITGTPGTTSIHEKQLLVFCGEQALIIDALKPAGKKEMTGQAFLAGYKHLLQ